MQKLMLPTIVCLLFLLSCKKFVDIPPPIDQISSETVFTTDAKARDAVSSIYGQMINGGASYFSKQQLSVVAGLASDELSRFNPNTELTEILNNEMQASNSSNSALWKSFYQTIYYANACKEGLEASSAISSALKTQLLAEVVFLRAFCHFYLVQLYGDVPLVLSTSQEINSVIPRTSSKSVYEQLIQDLLSAAEHLPVTFKDGERIRPTRWSAKALLARIYLYRQQWNDAKAQASDVIGSGLFTLPLPSTVFLKNSGEAIWQLRPLTGILPEIRETRPSGTVPKVFLRPAVAASFSPGDLRLQHWTGSVVNSGVPYIYPSKYKNISATVTEYYMLLRAAEQYLIRAEAKAMLGEHEPAIDDVNVIRERAALTALPYTLSAAELITAIEQERLHEFFSEFNHRWFDLKRTQRLHPVLSPLKPNWQATDTLFPIPLIEMMRNPNMTQNEGY